MILNQQAVRSHRIALLSLPILVFCIILPQNLHSQARQRKSLSLTLANHVPVFGTIGQVFKPAMGGEITYSSGEPYGLFNLGLGFHRFRARPDTFVLDLGYFEPETVTFSDYWMLPMFVSARIGFGRAEKLQAFWGIRLGYILSIVHIKGVKGISGVDETRGGSVELTPSFGAAWIITDQLMLSLEGRSVFSLTFEPRGEHWFTTALSLTYFFEAN